MYSPKFRLVANLTRQIVRFAALIGLVQIVEMSPKGRLTQFTERLEPAIRRKLIRFKWFPPAIIAINPVPPPNCALYLYFSKKVHFINDNNNQRDTDIGPWYAQPSSPIKPLHLVKRRGSPWEMLPSQRISKTWRLETSSLLGRLGIQEDKPIVLLAIRDSAYYESLQTDTSIIPGPETLPDTYIRNPEIVTYSLAAERLSELGCAVVHFGSKTSSLPNSLSGSVFDYSGQYRTPKDDLLLAQHCLMMMSGASGAWALASLFNRPVSYSNLYVPFIGGVSARDLFMPQLLWNSKEQRLLSFQEMADTAGRYSYQSNCESDGIELVKNSAEEIADHALETFHRIRGTFVEHAEDLELHREFNRIQERSSSHQNTRSPIGTTFLRRYRELL